MPWVLGADACRATGRLSSTTARPTARRSSPRRSARASCASRGAASAPPASPACAAAPHGRRLLHGLRRLAGPGASFRGSPAGASRGAADLVLGRAARRARGAWPLTPGSPTGRSRCELRRRTGLAALRPRPDARRAAASALLALGIRDRRFGWPLEMVLRAAAAGWRIDEVGVRYRPRVGRSKVTGTLRGTVRTVRDMARGAAMRWAAASVALLCLAGCADGGSETTPADARGAGVGALGAGARVETLAARLAARARAGGRHLGCGRVSLETRARADPRRSFRVRVRAQRGARAGARRSPAARGGAGSSGAGGRAAHVPRARSARQQSGR